jgi:8-oxo-dGTP diphosphatase
MTHHEVVAALIVQENRILLGQRSAHRMLYPDVWDLFGGHVEPGEQQQEALVRELQEELDIIPTQWTFLETITLDIPTFDNKPPDQMTVHLYRVSAWLGTPLNRQPEEHSDIGWYSVDEATTLPLADASYPTLFARYLALP